MVKVFWSVVIKWDERVVEVAGAGLSFGFFEGNWISSLSEGASSSEDDDFS